MHDLSSGTPVIPGSWKALDKEAKKTRRFIPPHRLQLSCSFPKQGVSPRHQMIRSTSFKQGRHLYQNSKEHKTPPRISPHLYTDTHTPLLAPDTVHRLLDHGDNVYSLAILQEYYSLYPVRLVAVSCSLRNIRTNQAVLRLLGIATAPAPAPQLGWPDGSWP